MFNFLHLSVEETFPIGKKKKKKKEKPPTYTYSSLLFLSLHSQQSLPQRGFPPVPALDEYLIPPAFHGSALPFLRRPDADRPSGPESSRLGVNDIDSSSTSNNNTDNDDNNK